MIWTSQQEQVRIVLSFKAVLSFYKSLFIGVPECSVSNANENDSATLINLFETTNKQKFCSCIILLWFQTQRNQSLVVDWTLKPWRFGMMVLAVVKLSHDKLKKLVGFRSGKKNLQNSEKFGNSFIKNDIIYMNLLFIYKNPIILNLLNIVALKFTMYILVHLFETAHHWKIDFLQLRHFTFYEHFLHNKNSKF